MKSIFAFFLMVVVFGLAACSDQPIRKPDPTYETASANPFIPANYRAADSLLAQLKNHLSQSQPMIVATMVNIDALEKSSTLGRLVSEQVSARFSQAGYSMVEMKFRNNIYIKQDQGELLLTREIKNVAQSHNAQAVIVGTYGESGDMVFINLKVIQPATNVVLAVHDYALPLDSNIRSMLRQSIR